MHNRLTFAVAALVLAGCSSEPAPPDAVGGGEPAPVASSPTAAAPSPDATTGDEAVLTATGYGSYRVGDRVAAENLRESERISEDCRLFSDPAVPGVSIMTDGAGTIQRVSVGSPSAIATVQGIKIGSPEVAIRAAYPGITAEPHEYIGAPGKNLYTGRTGRPRLRFEIGEDGSVTQMHGGRAPFLSNSEGCA